MMLGSGGGTNTSIGGSGTGGHSQSSGHQSGRGPSWNLADRVAERREAVHLGNQTAVEATPVVARRWGQMVRD